MYIGQHAVSWQEGGLRRCHLGGERWKIERERGKLWRTEKERGKEEIKGAKYRQTEGKYGQKKCAWGSNIRYRHIRENILYTSYTKKREAEHVIVAITIIEELLLGLCSLPVLSVSSLSLVSISGGLFLVPETGQRLNTRKWRRSHDIQLKCVQNARS